MTTVLPFPQAKPFGGLLEPLFLWQRSPAPLLFHGLYPAAPGGVLQLAHLSLACPLRPAPLLWFPPSFQTPQSGSQNWFQSPSQRLSSLWSQPSEGLLFSLGIEFTAPTPLPATVPSFMSPTQLCPWTSPNILSSFPPQGLCTSCSLCLEYFFPRCLHRSLLHFPQVCPDVTLPERVSVSPASYPMIIPSSPPTKLPVPPMHFWSPLYMLHSQFVPRFIVPVFPIHT